MSDQVLNGRDVPLRTSSVRSEQLPRRPAPKRTLPQRLGAMGASGLIWQALLLGLVCLVAAYLFGGMQAKIEARGISTGFAFLRDQAGFSIGESLVPFTSASTFADAFVVGILNALKVSAASILVATVLGVVIGIARVSPNLLIAKLSGLYVELFRNTPQLVQIAFWYTLVTLAPSARNAVEPVPGLFISNRGVQVPWLADEGSYSIFALLIVGGIAAFAFRRWQRRPSLTPGLSRPKCWAVMLGFVFGLPLLGWLGLGAPFALSVPELRGFNFVGGLALSAEFVALALGLSLYIASFIAEIVRAGIQSVPRGQLEAAKAIGLAKTTLYAKIILPQALRVMIPPMSAQYISLIKNSSLGIAVGYPELFNITNTITTITGRAVECTVIMMGAYLCISLTVSGLMNIYNSSVQLKER